MNAIASSIEVLKCSLRSTIVLKCLTIQFTIFMFIFYVVAAFAKDIDEIGPFDGQRNKLLPGESFYKREQYWSSSVIQIDSEPFFNLSTRSTSLRTGIHYDFILNIFGKNCRKVNIMILTLNHTEDDNAENQFGQITFNDGSEYNFRFSVKTFTESNAIAFQPGDVDTLIRMMQKYKFMVVRLPSIGKKIFYDLRGFSSSAQRTSKMCMASNPRQ